MFGGNGKRRGQRPRNARLVCRLTLSDPFAWLDAGFKAELRECFLVLDGMQQRGQHFDPQTAQVYQQLAGMFGG